MRKQHLCPWWLGYTFIIPLRKYLHDPGKILGPHVVKGMQIMDYGCAMGYFSIPLARMTGSNGKVYCVDIQERMLAKLRERAAKHGVAYIIEPLLAGKDYNPPLLNGKLDFILLFAVVHEVQDRETLFADMHSMLRPGGKILFIEPAGHVTPYDFRASINIALGAGFTIACEKPVKKGLEVLLQR